MNRMVHTPGVEGKVENPALRQAQGGERSRTTRGGGEGKPGRMQQILLPLY